MNPKELAEKCDSILESKSSSISVMVLGAHGIGKSTLANSLLGQKVAVESEPGVIAESGVTKSVICYEKNVKGNIMKVYDTPGLLDSTLEMEATLRDISTVISNVDLILFCIDMKDDRFIKGNNIQIIMRVLSDSLGSLIWIKTVFVLVRANMAIELLRDQFKPNQEVEVKQAFEAKIKRWDELLKKEMKGDFDISVVPTGFYSQPKLFESDKVYWLSNFWETCFFSLQTIESRAALFKVNIDRLVEKDDGNSSREPHEQHIIMSPGFIEKAKKASEEVAGFMKAASPFIKVAVALAVVVGKTLKT